MILTEDQLDSIEVRRQLGHLRDDDIGNLIHSLRTCRASLKVATESIEQKNKIIKDRIEEEIRDESMGWMKKSLKFRRRVHPLASALQDPL